MVDTITKTDLNQLERYLDQVWGQLGIDVNFTRHFLDRVNDPRNGQAITYNELRKLFVDTYKKYGSMFSRMGKKDDEIEGVLTDITTKVNSPFVLKWDNRTREFDLVAKTVMRKSNFRPNNNKEKQFKVESMELFENKNYIKNHPAVQRFEDYKGEYFVNLKPGWEWSGQRSFGGETIREIVGLLKQVKKTKSISEGVIDHSRYLRSHGKKATGTNHGWMFTIDRMGHPGPDKIYMHKGQASLTDAGKAALSYFKSKYPNEHISQVYVMENINRHTGSPTQKLMENLKEIIRKNKR